MNESEQIIKDKVNRMRTLWTEQWLQDVPKLVPMWIERENPDEIIQYFAGLGQVSSLCQWIRDTFNEGRFNHGDWCMNRCPATHNGCSHLGNAIGAHFMAVARHSRHEPLLEHETCSVKCSAYEQCAQVEDEDRWAFCLTALRDNMAIPVEQDVAWGIGLETEVFVMLRERGI